jgi:O-antigen chain-terminating methyltransferase
MMPDIKTIDIEKIMEEIRADIAAKGLTDDIPEFGSFSLPQEEASEFNMNILEDTIERLGFCWKIESDHEIRSRPGLAGRLIIFVKRIIRKCIRFYMLPVILEQNEVNKTVLDSLVQLENFVKTQSMQNDGKNEIEKAKRS